jgi:methylated-DNA-[protein]-cysteine S-methyltransferase
MSEASYNKVSSRGVNEVYETRQVFSAGTGKRVFRRLSSFVGAMDEITVTESSDHSSAAIAFALFDTALGVCGIAWNEHGVVGVHLPDRDAAATRARLQRKFRDAQEAEPSVELAATIRRITELLRGERVDLSSVPLDMTGIAKFERDVYVAAREIPPGDTLTYGDIAKRLGQPHAARDVGVALARNPFAIVVPCHRVVAANGKTGGFSAGGGVATKLKLLAIEGGMGPLFDSAI